MTNLLKSQSNIDPVFSELEYFKTNNRKQEGEIAKLQTQIQKLESLNKKLQANIALNGKNINNTSISFFLPSEFTILWEKLIKTELLEALDAYIENYILIAHMAQDIMLITYKQTDLLIKSKIDLILKSLNIKELSQEQKDKLLLKFQSFFQEHFAEIFLLDKEIINKIKDELKKTSASYTFKWNKELFKEEIAKKQFDMMIMSVFKVCLYMLLHEPVLTLDITEYCARTISYLFFNKKEFTNIEGFCNEKTPCVIVLPPPMLRKKFPYSDIKAAVYSLYESNEEIISECERNQQEIKKPRSLAQTPILSKIDTSGDIKGKRLIESPITPKLNTNAKSISNNFILCQNMATTPVIREKDKENQKHYNKIPTPVSNTNHIPIPIPTPNSNTKKANEDLKAKRNFDQPLIIKSNTISKQTPSIYSAKAFIASNNQSSHHQITKEISGEITSIKYNYYNKSSTISGYNRNEELRKEGDKVKSFNSMQNWNRKESYLNNENSIDSKSLSPTIKDISTPIYSIPSFNVIRNKNTYTSIENNSRGSFSNINTNTHKTQPIISTTSNNSNQISQSIYDNKTQQQSMPQQRQPRELTNVINKDYHDSSLLNYTNYQYENSKQKEYIEPHQKEYTSGNNWNNESNNITPTSTPSYYKDILNNQYANKSTTYIKPSGSNMICDQRYNVNQMKLDDLRYKYQVNSFKDSTPRGDNLAKYAIGEYYYKKKYNNNN